MRYATKVKFIDRAIYYYNFDKLCYKFKQEIRNNKNITFTKHKIIGRLKHHIKILDDNGYQNVLLYEDSQIEKISYYVLFVINNKIINIGVICDHFFNMSPNKKILGVNIHCVFNTEKIFEYCDDHNIQYNQVELQLKLNEL